MKKLSVAAILICCACAVYATLTIHHTSKRIDKHGPFESLANWGVSLDTLRIEYPGHTISAPDSMEYIAPIMRPDSTGKKFRFMLARDHVRLGTFEAVADGQEKQFLGAFTYIAVYPPKEGMDLIFRSLLRPREEL